MLSDQKKKKKKLLRPKSDISLMFLAHLPELVTYPYPITRGPESAPKGEDWASKTNDYHSHPCSSDIRFTFLPICKIYAYSLPENKQKISSYHNIKLKVQDLTVVKPRFVSSLDLETYEENFAPHPLPNR